MVDSTDLTCAALGEEDAEGESDNHMMNTNHLTVIYAEDSDDDAFLFCRAADACSVDVVRVKNGDEAKVQLETVVPSDGQAQGPVALVTDLHMPGCDGLALIQWVRTKPEWNELPAVVVSASHAQKDIDACKEAGANGFFVKPASLEGFSHLFQALLELWSENTASRGALLRFNERNRDLLANEPPEA